MPTLDELDRDLFDTATPTSTAAIRQRIITEATRQGVDPALALALAQRESRFDPGAMSPTDVEGLFQVTVPTGRIYGQTAQTRSDPDVSMRAGIGYLADLLRETKGDVRQALARYGDPNEPDYPEKVLANYARQKASLSAGGTQQVSRIDDLERELFGGTAKPSPAAPQRQTSAPLPATEPSDIVLDITKDQPPGPAPSAYQQAVSQIQPLQPFPLAAARGEHPGSGWGDVAGMGVQGITTAAGATIGGMTGPLAPVAVPALAGLGSYYGHRLSQQLGLTPGTPELLPRTLSDYLSFLPAVPGFGYAALPWSRGGKALRTAQEATSTAQQAAQQELVEAQAQRAQTIAERERASQAALSQARTTARTQTEAQHAEWLQKMQTYNQELKGRLVQHRDLTRTAEREAYEATVAAKNAYRTQKADVYQEALQKRNEAVAKWKQTLAEEQRDLEGALIQRRTLMANAEGRVQRLNAEAQDAYATKGQQAYAEAVQKVRQGERERLQAVKAYDDAVREHTAAVQRAQTLPQRYLPPRPAEMPATQERVSQHYYGQFTRDYGQVPVDLGDDAFRQTLSKVWDDIGKPLPSMQPTRMQRAVQDLEELELQAPAGRIYEIMKDIGAETQSNNPRVARAAKQLFRGLSETLEASAPQEAVDLLRTAKQTWMQEEGVSILQQALARRRSSSIIAEDAQGRLVLNPRALRSLVLDTGPELRKWLPPAEYKRLVQETRPFLNVPAMPKGTRPPRPDAAPLPGMVDVETIGVRPTPKTIWDLPKGEQTGFRPLEPRPFTAPPPNVRVRDIGPEPPAVTPDYPPPVTIERPPAIPPPVEPKPPGPVRWEPPPTLREVADVQPELKFPRMVRMLREGGLPILAALGVGLPTSTAAKIGLAIAGGDVAMYGVARLLLSPVGRPLLQDAIRNGGVMSPELAAVLGALAAEGQSLVQPREQERKR